MCFWQVFGLHLLRVCMHRGFSEMTAEHIRQTATPCRLFIYVTSPCPAEGPSLFLRKCVECVCEGGVDGRSRASSVASVSNQALGRLLFVPGKEVWRRFIFWAEAGGINSPNEPEAIFYPQWPAMFPTSGRSVTQQHEVWAYYPGSYVPSGHLLSFGKIPLGSAATRV